VQVHLQLHKEGHDGHPKLQLVGKVQQFPEPQVGCCLQQFDDLGQEKQQQQQLHLGKEQQLNDGKQFVQLLQQLLLHGLQSLQQQQHCGNFRCTDNPSQQQQQQQIQDRLKHGMPLHKKS
jgi:hypothetical protein